MGAISDKGNAEVAVLKDHVNPPSARDHGSQEGPKLCSLAKTYIVAPERDSEVSDCKTLRIHSVQRAEIVDGQPPFELSTEAFQGFAQTALEKYYLIPYPGSPRRKINRLFHGAVHACRAAINCDLLIALYQKFAPELLVRPDGSKITREDIFLIKMAALYHDCANISEYEAERIPGRSKEAAHAQRFINDMLELGFPPQRVEAIAWGIEGKEEEHAVKNIYQKLIHDADALEILRIISPEEFLRESLDISQDFQGNSACSSLLSGLISRYYDWMQSFNSESGGVGALHAACEGAVNCYEETYNSLRDQFLESLVIRATENRKTIHFDDIHWEDLSVLDLFLKTDECLDSLVATLPDHTSQTGEQAIHELNTKGGLIRIIQIRNPFSAEHFEELSVLKENQEILDEHKIDDDEGLREYFRRQDQASSVFTPRGKERTPFKWRPASFFVEGVYPKLFSLPDTSDSLAIVINPHADHTRVPFIYKRNAFSHKAASGELEYEPKQGGLKNRESFDALIKKAHEMQRRSDGLEEDPSLHYLGTDLAHNECLTHYDPKQLETIVLLNTHKETAIKALMLRAKFGATFNTFATYTPGKGLTPLSEKEVLSLIIKKKVKEHPAMIELKKGPKIENRVHRFTSITQKMAISIKKSALSDAQLQRIRMLVETQLEEYERVDTIDDAHLEEDSEHLCISINLSINEEEDEKESEKTLLQLIQKIEKIAETQDEINIEEINNITRIPKPGEKISPENPLRFIFSHPEDPRIQCTIQRSGGKEHLQLHYPDGSKRVIHLQKPLFKEIATLYLRHEMANLSRVIASEEARKSMRSQGIESLDIHPIIHKKKLHLALSFELIEGANRIAVAQGIQEMFHTVFPGRKKGCVQHETLPDIEVPQKETLYFSTPYLLDIDRLTAYFSPPYPVEQA